MCPSDALLAQAELHAKLVKEFNALMAEYQGTAEPTREQDTLRLAEIHELVSEMSAILKTPMEGDDAAAYQHACAIYEASTDLLKKAIAELRTLVEKRKRNQQI